MANQRCPDWPICRCGRLREFWRDKDISAEAPYTREEVEDVRFVFIRVLKCLAQRCPDIRIRRQAQVQLLDPVWREGEGEQWLTLL
jgi:hypothetical protein